MSLFGCVSAETEQVSRGGQRLKKVSAAGVVVGVGMQTFFFVSLSSGRWFRRNNQRSFLCWGLRSLSLLQTERAAFFSLRGLEAMFLRRARHVTVTRW